MGDQNLLSRALCFGRHVKPLAPAVFAVVCTHSSFKDGWRQAVVKTIAESLSQHDENMYRTHLAG
jgi:hypothetical protein